MGCSPQGVRISHTSNRVRLLTVKPTTTTREKIESGKVRLSPLTKISEIESIAALAVVSVGKQRHQRKICRYDLRAVVHSCL